MALFKKPTEADKVSKEIEATLFRKNSMVSVIQNEKNSLENSKLQVFKDLGEYVYEQHLKGDTTLDFNQYFNEVERLSGEIAQKAEKELEISARYDEEVNILNSKLNMLGVATQNATPNMQNAMPNMQNAEVLGKICTSCQKPVAADDMFCQECGNKL